MLWLAATYIFLRKKPGKMLADDFIGLVAEQPFCAGIPGKDDSFWRNDENGVLTNVGN